jgi:glycosyltransferase involved in cell wall biosynthesis
MTLDALGGVWRYGMDLAAGLADLGYDFVFAGLGPSPSSHQLAEAERLGEIVWLDAPLDWTTEDEKALDRIPALLAELVASEGIDLVHLNLPSQAAGLDLPVPVLTVSHSCVVTWFAAMRGGGLPSGWQWQQRRNRAGFDAADAVIAPSRSHAAMLRASYGPIAGLTVVYNASGLMPEAADKQDYAFAAGRWWDEGKNGALLDAAAPAIAWPVIMAGADRGPSGQHLAIHNAEHLGELPHAKVACLLSRAGIAVSPSLYEPFGLSVLEAARAGAALVLSDIPIYRELWQDTALFADPHDAKALAEAVNRLAGDAGLRRRLVTKARARSADFSLAAQAEAMDRLYQGLLERRPLPLAV